MPIKAKEIKYAPIYEEKNGSLSVYRSIEKNQSGTYLFCYQRTVVTTNFYLIAAAYYTDARIMAVYAHSPLELYSKYSCHMTSTKPRMIISQLKKHKINYKIEEEAIHIYERLKPDTVMQIQTRWSGIASGTDDFCIYQAIKK